MSQLITGSICLTDIIKYAKDNHPAFIKANNGKVYCNIQIWINDQPDDFDNDTGIKLNRPKDSNADRPYIGNGRKVSTKPSQASEKDIENLGYPPAWD